MDEANHAKQMAQQFFLEAAREHDGDRAKLLASVASTWLELLSFLEHRSISAQDLVIELLREQRAKGQVSAGRFDIR